MSIKKIAKKKVAKKVAKRSVPRKVISRTQYVDEKKKKQEE